MVTGVLSARVDVDRRIFGLINSTVNALKAADLDESIASLVARLIEKPSRLVVLRRGTDKASIVAELEPFAELLLLDVRAIARRRADSATKTRWIEQAMCLCGV